MRTLLKILLRIFPENVGGIHRSEMEETVLDGYRASSRPLRFALTELGNLAWNGIRERIHSWVPARSGASVSPSSERRPGLVLPDQLAAGCLERHRVLPHVPRLLAMHGVENVVVDDDRRVPVTKLPVPEYTRPVFRPLVRQPRSLDHKIAIGATPLWPLSIGRSIRIERQPQDPTH